MYGDTPHVVAGKGKAKLLPGSWTCTSTQIFPAYLSLRNICARGHEFKVADMVLAIAMASIRHAGSS
jgi:hypothetical protein